MKKTVWLTKHNYLVIVSEIDVSGMYYYEYSPNEFLRLETSPKQFNLEYIGNL